MGDTEESIQIICGKEQIQYAERIKSAIGKGEILSVPNGCEEVTANCKLLVLLLDVYSSDEVCNKIIDRFQDIETFPPILAISTDNNPHRFFRLSLMYWFAKVLYLKAPFDIKSLENKIGELNDIKPLKPFEQFKQNHSQEQETSYRNEISVYSLGGDRIVCNVLSLLEYKPINVNASLEKQIQGLAKKDEAQPVLVIADGSDDDIDFTGFDEKGIYRIIYHWRYPVIYLHYGDDYIGRSHTHPLGILSMGSDMPSLILMYPRDIPSCPATIYNWLNEIKKAIYLRNKHERL